MGIRGLTSFIRQSLPSFADHVNLSAVSSTSLTPIVLIVDGNAFFHYFCLERLGNAPGITTDYRWLSLSVQDWIQKCRSSGVELMFIFDGSKSPDKLPTKLSRLQKQSADVCKGLNWCRQSLERSIDHEGDPNTSKFSDIFSKMRLQSVPPLLAQQCLMELLAKLGISYMTASGEADGAIAHMAKTYSAFAILSNDSDFICYDTGSAGWIPLWTMGFDTDGCLYAHVIRRSRIAATIGIDIQNLCHLAALVGNDFSNAPLLHHIHERLLTPVEPESLSRRIVQTLSSKELCNGHHIDYSSNTTISNKVKVSNRKSKRKPVQRKKDHRIRTQQRKEGAHGEEKDPQQQQQDGDSASTPGHAPASGLDWEERAKNSKISSPCSGLKAVTVAANLIRQASHLLGRNGLIGSNIASVTSIVATLFGLCLGDATLVLTEDYLMSLSDSHSDSVLKTIRMAHDTAHMLSHSEIMYSSTPQSQSQCVSLLLGNTANSLTLQGPLGTDMSLVYSDRVFLGRTLSGVFSLNSSNDSDNDIDNGDGVLACSSCLSYAVFSGFRSRLYMAMFSSRRESTEESMKSEEVEEFYWTATDGFHRSVVTVDGNQLRAATKDREDKQCCLYHVCCLLLGTCCSRIEDCRRCNVNDKSSIDDTIVSQFYGISGSSLILLESYGATSSTSLSRYRRRHVRTVLCLLSMSLLLLLLSSESTECLKAKLTGHEADLVDYIQHVITDWNRVEISVLHYNYAVEVTRLLLEDTCVSFPQHQIDVVPGRFPVSTALDVWLFAYLHRKYIVTHEQPFDFVVDSFLLEIRSVSKLLQLNDSSHSITPNIKTSND
eukprot:gene10691-22325_t